jgi:ABC-type Mn2+/Zn2+ transport system ATPase subunit
VYVTQNDTIDVRKNTWRDIIVSEQVYDKIIFDKSIDAAGLKTLFEKTYGGDIDSTLPEPSGGERQRLLIARGLYRLQLEKLPILMMDEPDNHIDKSFPDIIEKIKKLHHGPIFLTLHNT